MKAVYEPWQLRYRLVVFLYTEKSTLHMLPLSEDFSDTPLSRL